MLVTLVQENPIGKAVNKYKFCDLFSFLMSGMWLFLVADTLVKLKNLKLLDLRHNKMKEVFYLFNHFA